MRCSHIWRQRTALISGAIGCCCCSGATEPESRGRASLRQALYFLRRSLGDGVLSSRGADELGVDRSRLFVDVAELQRALAEQRLEDALALYRGDFLADFNIDDAPEFERWAADKRRELRNAVTEAAWKLSDRASAAGAHESAIRWARRALDLADFAERDVRRAMHNIASAGDVPGALAVYDTLRQRLAAELETSPQSATTELAGQLRSGSLPAPSRSPVASDEPAAPASNDRVAGVARRAAAPTLKPLGRRRGYAIAALVAACAVGVFAVRARSSSTMDPASANRVAVLPFTVRSNSGGVSYLREGAATLLSLALDGAGQLRAVDPNAILSTAPPSLDLEASRDLASSLGAGQFVVGEIEAVGARLRVVATLYDHAGHARGTATAAGEESRVFELVDSLARRLAVSALTDSTVRLANAAATSTHSIAAFKSFLVGETALRSGEYREAVSALQDAVASDTAFGLAYYRLSLAREWTDGEISSDSAAALAEHFASRLPDRDRELLAARRAFVRRDGIEAERLTREVIASYPTDADAWAQLGEIRFHLGPNAGHDIDDARAPFVTVLRYRPNDLSARVHLTRIAARDGDTTHVDEWSGGTGWLGSASEIGTYELAAMRAVVLGDTRAKDSLAAVTKRTTDNIILSAAWRLSIYSGDPDAALYLFARRPAPELVARDAMADVDIARGRFAAPRASSSELIHARAIALCRTLALPSAPDLPDLARRAHDALVATSVSASDTAALVAARLIEARYPVIPAIANRMTLRGDEARTVRALTDAIRSTSVHPQHALDDVMAQRTSDAVLAADRLYDVVASVRAEALHQLGRDNEAVAWLASIGMNSGGLSAGIPVAARRMAELEDARGNRAAAARYHAKLAKMWHSCDPELRVIRDGTVAR